MARFNTNLPTPAPAARVHPQVAAQALGAMVSADFDADASCGPGWFESSRELVRGLEVMEHAAGDAALHEWFRACQGR
jgi:hypothetical protein